MADVLIAWFIIASLCSVGAFVWFWRRYRRFVDSDDTYGAPEGAFRDQDEFAPSDEARS